uniref:Uncharacterized protein n=1 Tax=Nelumbo nucifera TaxID=4432 RepID=A0A822Y137_NELNU|nr:TPA_asm: hypothetical protein HUJ06_026695 [Nelumbo nucifera]
MLNISLTIHGRCPSNNLVILLVVQDRHLILFLNQDPNLLRTYAIQQEGSLLIGLLVFLSLLPCIY